jgi:hypothetical protein
MAYVKVPKDLTKVKTKVALNLTKRQLIGFSIAGIIGFPIYLFSKNIMSNDMAVLVMSIIVLPILFATIYEKDNLPFEKHLEYILRFHKSKKIRIYKAKSIYNADENEIIGKDKAIKNTAKDRDKMKAFDKRINKRKKAIKRRAKVE